VTTALRDLTAGDGPVPHSTGSDATHATAGSAGRALGSRAGGSAPDERPACAPSRSGNIPHAAARRYFVTRHAGALEWASRHGVVYDEHLAHLDPGSLRVGDHVYGTLPVHLAAELCAMGVLYWHLVLAVKPEGRGQEHTADQLEAMGAHFQRYRVEQVERKEGQE
jgi:CRISPR-associated protein Csx16